MVELAQKLFPPGVIQALSGDDHLGPWLTAHPDIDKISFTGSIATGKKVMESASKTLKRVTLELYERFLSKYLPALTDSITRGGNDAAIICKSANIEEMAPKVVFAAFFNTGQVCMAVKRVFIHQDIYNDFRDAMVRFTKSMKTGDGMDEDTMLGPIQNSMQYDRVRGFYDDVRKQGQKVAVGDSNVVDSGGYFVTPTIIDNPKDDSRLMVEEPFGKSDTDDKSSR